MPAADEIKKLNQLTEAQKEKLILLGLESAMKQFGSLDFLSRPEIDTKLKSVNDQHLKSHVAENQKDLKRCIKETPVDVAKRIAVELQAIQNKPSSSWRRGDQQRYYDRFEEPTFLNSYLTPEQKISMLQFGKRIYSIIYPRWWGGQGRISESEMPLKPNQIYPEASFYQQVKPTYQNHLDAQQVAESLNHFGTRDTHQDSNLFADNGQTNANLGNHRSLSPVTKASVMQKYFPKVENPEILPPAGISTLEMRSIERARSQPKQKRQYAVIEVDIHNREKAIGSKVVFREKEVHKVSQDVPVSTLYSNSTHNTKKKELKGKGQISMQPTSVPGFGLNHVFAHKSVDRKQARPRSKLISKKNKKGGKNPKVIQKSKNTTLGDNPLRSLNLRNAQSKIKSLIDEDKVKEKFRKNNYEGFEKYGSDEEAENIDYLTSELDRHQYYNQESVGFNQQAKLGGFDGQYNLKMSNATSAVGEEDHRYRSGSKQESNFDSGNQSLAEQVPSRNEQTIQGRTRDIARKVSAPLQVNDALEDGQKVSPSDNLNSDDNIFQYSRTLDRERASKRGSHPLNIVDEYCTGRSGANVKADLRNSDLVNIDSINYSKDQEYSAQKDQADNLQKESLLSQSAFEIASRLLNSKIIAHLNYNQERQDFEDQDQLTEGTGDEEQYTQESPDHNSRNDIANVQERMSNLKPGNTLSGQEFYKQSELSANNQLNSQPNANYHKKQSSHDPSTISGKKNLEQRKQRDMIYNNYTKGQFVSETGVVPIEFGSDQKLGNETSSSFSSFNANDDMKSFFRKEFVNKGGKIIPSEKKGQYEVGNNSVVSSQISYSYGPSKKDYNKRKEILN